jgi:hypothetical protein
MKRDFFSPQSAVLSPTLDAQRTGDRGLGTSDFYTQLIIGLLFTFVVSFALLAHADATQISLFGIRLPSVCLFRRITGLECPGCGLTRAVVLALHGQFYQSFMVHVLGIPAAILLLLQIPYRFLLLVRPKLEFVNTPQGRRWVEIVATICVLVPWLIKFTLKFTA